MTCLIFLSEGKRCVKAEYYDAKKESTLSRQRHIEWILQFSILGLL